MTTPEPITVQPAPVFDLDLEKLGSMLRALPAVSARVGHKTFKGTMWYGAAAAPEWEFVRDMFRMSVPEVIEKWYGGLENAERYGLALAEAAAAAVPRKRRTEPAT